MKKFLLFTTGILLVLLLSFLGFVQYQRYAAFQAPIPRSATSVIRVNVYSIYKSLLVDYFRSRKKETTVPFRGISIPSDIFLYTIKGNAPTTLFCTLPIDNIQELEQSLQEKKGYFTSGGTKAGIAVLYSIDRRWTIAYNKDRMAIAYAFSRDQTAGTLTGILQQQNTVPVSGSNFRSIDDQEGHITFLAPGSKGRADFNKGQIDASWELPAKGYQLPSVTMPPVSRADNALGMWLYMDLKPFLEHKTFRIGNMDVHGDSLLAAQPHGLELTISKPVIQRDSVVTYDYNDDFEKVATVSIRENQVPGIQLLCSCNNRLSSYLERRHIIDPDSGVINRDVFPLYQLLVAGTDSSVQIGTTKETVTAPRMKSDAFFSLVLHVDQLLQQQDFKPLVPYLKTIQRLEATAKKAGTSLVFKTTLTFKDRNKHSLLQVAGLSGS